MRFNLYCNRNLFRADIESEFWDPSGVSIFIVIEIYSEGDRVFLVGPVGKFQSLL